LNSVSTKVSNQNYWNNSGQFGGSLTVAGDAWFSGNVGIGTTAPSYKLTVVGTAWVTSGTWSGSDRRWKKDITPIQDSLEKVTQLQGVNYYWRDQEFLGQHFTTDKQIGLIAQDTEKNDYYFPR